MFDKKREQISKKKQKAKIRKTNINKVIISDLSTSDKKQLPIFILAIKVLLSKI